MMLLDVRHDAVGRTTSSFLICMGKRACGATNGVVTFG